MEWGPSAIAVTLLILLPIPPSHLLEDLSKGEIIIESESIWTVLEWNDLIKQGIQPMRQLSETEMLAWGPLSEQTKPAKLTEYRGTINSADQFLVIFEPWLPRTVRSDINTKLDGLNLNPENIYFPIENSPAPQITMITPDVSFIDWWQELKNMHGLHWIEPILVTNGRNDLAAAIMQNGGTTNQPAWLLGLDGSGIIIANADSGIDRDHACFREATEAGASGSEWNNATGTPGQSHRKIVVLNETIDEWDSVGDDNYQHGTHIAGSLACRSIWEIAAENQGDWNNSTPGEGTSIAHGARLVVEDVVNGEGWNIPQISDLFWEAADNGAIIRSDSWGDVTTDYTSRTSQFDTWLYQVPWSISFVAPGNTGAEILEPANGLNVVSVGVSAKDGTNDLWTLSPRESTAQGRMGVTIVAPGENVISAKADGLHDSNNDDLKSSTGSSMATPQAAAYAAVIQQMVEDGWISSNESRSITTTSSVRPDWAEYVNENLSYGNILLSGGFTPSGSLLKALMTLSGESLEGGRQSELILGTAPDNQQGWGRVNLSNLIDFEYLENNVGNVTIEPAENIWIHDSFRLDDNEWQNIVAGWINGGETNSVSNHKWKGEGAVGPFLSSGENVVWNVSLKGGEDFDIRLVWNSAPNIDYRDDLDLEIILPDGRIYLGNDFNESGIRDGIENIEGVHINSSILVGIDYVQVKIIARNVNVGPASGVIGLNGDKIGFALAIKGVDRDGVHAEKTWKEIVIINDENEEQGGVYTVKYGVIIILIILVIVLSLVAIDRVRILNNNDVISPTGEGQPSNHERGSLRIAEAVYMGDDDE